MSDYSRVLGISVLRPHRLRPFPRRAGEGDVAERTGGTVYGRGLDGVAYGTIDSHGDHVEIAGFVGGFGYFEEVFVDFYADAGGVGEEHVSAFSLVLVDEDGVGGVFVSEGVFLGDEVGDGCVDLDCGAGGYGSEEVVCGECGVVGLCAGGDLLDVGETATRCLDAAA